MSIRHQITATDVPLLVLDDGVVTAYAHRLVDAGHPVAVVGTSYPPVLPFLVGATGSSVAIVADVDDPIQMADVVDRVEERLGHVGRVVRRAADLPANPPAA